MEITRRYTLENWRTGEITLHEIPDDVYELRIEDVFEKVLSDMGGMGQNIIELIFYCLFHHDDWRVERTPLNRSRTVQKYTAVAIEMSTGVREELYGSGVPDFFLWDGEGQHRFIEVKASEDSLNRNQREWAEKHECNFYIAQLAPIGPDITDEDVIETNRIR